MSNHLTFDLSRRLYATAIKLGMPLLRAYQSRRIQRGKEDPARILEREGIASRPRPGGQIVWIHGASVGEALAALPVIQSLVEQSPDTSVVLTTGTVSSASVLKTRLPERTIHQFSPLDNPAWVQAFLAHWKPTAVVWIESEFWPNTLWSIHQLAIPLILMNGRVSERSYARWQRFPGIIGGILSCFDLCLAQSAEDARRLSYLGAPKVIDHGNLKLGAPPLPVDQDTLDTLLSRVVARPRWLASSTHDGEEIMAAEVHENLARDISGLITFVVPRHPERGPAIAQTLRERGLNVALRSAGDLPEAQTAIYIADSVGELGLFYRLCDIVFMGKSLVSPGGGQNPFEAAKLKRAVLFGPNMGNFVDLSAHMLACNAAHQVQNTDALHRELRRLLANPELIKTRATAADTFCCESANIIDDAVSIIIDTINRVTS